MSEGVVMERRTLLVGILWDLGLPIAVYYLCRGLGVGPVPALLAGGGAALLRVAAVALRKRRLDGVAALVAAGFAGMGGWFLLGDEHLMLAKEPIMSGGLGLVLLVSCLIGRPLMYAALRRSVGTTRRPSPPGTTSGRTVRSSGVGSPGSAWSGGSACWWRRWSGSR